MDGWVVLCRLILVSLHIMLTFYYYYFSTSVKN
jgi:hypothetical protein